MRVSESESEIESFFVHLYSIICTYRTFWFTMVYSVCCTFVQRHVFAAIAQALCGFIGYAFLKVDCPAV